MSLRFSSVDLVFGSTIFFEKSTFAPLVHKRCCELLALVYGISRAVCTSHVPVLSVEIDALHTAVGYVIAPEQLTAVRIVGHGPGVDQPLDQSVPDVRVQIQRLDGAAFAVAPVQLKTTSHEFTRWYKSTGRDRAIAPGGDRSRAASDNPYAVVDVDEERARRQLAEHHGGYRIDFVYVHIEVDCYRIFSTERAASTRTIII